jgi:protein TonB
MQALLHSLNIGTLATWLSVAGFGTIGVIVHGRHPESVVSETAETLLLDADFILGDASPPAPESATVETPPTETTTASPAETLQDPPELPVLAETAPLPEIPELPEIAPKPAEINIAPTIQLTTRSTPTKPVRATPPRTASGSQASSQTGSSTRGTGMSSASRLAAGRMTPPSYPPEARRKGQSGTVVVEFTIDASGRVISAYAQSPSPWPLLNNEAVRTVRGWKFPSGGVMKLQRPIVFQLR